MIDIIKYEHEAQKEGFYSTMGRFFAYRDYAKEMGGWQFYNQDNSTWFLAYTKKNELIGFCAMFNENTHVFLDNFYILPEHRGKGYSKELFDTRLKAAKRIGKDIRAIADNEIQMKNYERNGFVHYGDRGRYKKYVIKAGQ